MFTDIVGYTSLMGTNEDQAFDVLRRNREIQYKFIKKFNGTLIKEIGDGILASFSLDSEAVYCAIEIQKECRKQHIPLKIGIHEGEIVIQDQDLIGDSVNVASRLQEAAHEGEISISYAVYRNIKNKSDIKTEFVDEMLFKNVDEPIRIYKVSSEEIQLNASYTSNSDSGQRNKKSIAVLPFADISPNQDNEFFSDGLTEEIISDLSQIEDLRVISRTSANLFKGSKKSVTEIARELRVQYILEGSVRKAGNNLRIIAQLIDAPNDTHLWAEKYSGTLEDVFDIQEKVSRSIVDALHIKISPKVSEKIAEHPIDDVKAYEIHLRARYEIMLISEDALNHAIKLLNNGLKLIGDNEILYADLGFAHLWHYEFISKKDKDHIKKTEEYIDKVFAINPNSSIGHSLKGHYNLRIGKIPEAASEYHKSLEINPNEPDSLFRLGWVYVLIGKKKEGSLLLSRLLEIDPLTPLNHLIGSASELVEGKFDQAIRQITRALELEPKNPLLMYWNAVILACKHEDKEACVIFEHIENLSNIGLFDRLSAFFKNAIQGNKKDAVKIVTGDFKRVAKEDEFYPIWMAECYALIGEKMEAIDWLEHGVDYGFLHYDWLSKHDPFLGNIRREPRFDKLLEKVKSGCENFEAQLKKSEH